MASELIDLRAKITDFTDKWLDAESNVTGRDRAEIVREILHLHSQSKVEEFSVRQEAYQAKGLAKDNWGKREAKT